jgi:hypothetical protein
MKSLSKLFSILRISIVSVFVLCLIFASCDNKLAFEYKSYQRKTSLPCKENCPHINVKIPYASNAPGVADSINKKIYMELKKIISFEEKQSTSSDYNKLLEDFINSYEKLQKQFPTDTFGWEGEIKGKIIHLSEDVLNIEIKYYTFTGGAHGYQGLRSLIFDPATGKTIPNDDLFVDVERFKDFAERKFRLKYKIPENASINDTGFLFDDETFHLPQNIFYTDNGLKLYYNTYEIASYVAGSKELDFTYDELKPYLLIK